MQGQPKSRLSGTFIAGCAIGIGLGTTVGLYYYYGKKRRFPPPSSPSSDASESSSEAPEIQLSEMPSGSKDEAPHANGTSNNSPVQSSTASTSSQPSTEPAANPASSSTAQNGVASHGHGASQDEPASSKSDAAINVQYLPPEAIRQLGNDIQGHQLGGLGWEALEQGAEKLYGATSGSGAFESPVEANDGPVPYFWTEEDDEVTVTVKCSPGVLKNDVVFAVTTQTLKLSLQGVDVINGTLFQPVKPADCTWQFDGSGLARNLMVTLSKRDGGSCWTNLCRSSTSTAG